MATVSNFKQPARSQATPSRSRRAFRASFALEPSALRSKGAGNAGRPMRPIAACAMSVVERTRVSQVTPEIARHSPRSGLRLIARSPRRPGFLATVACGCFRKLDASIGASGPHDFAVREASALVFSAARVHRIPPHVRDDRETPLQRDGTAGDMKVICASMEGEIFLQKGLDRQITDLPVGLRGAVRITAPDAPSGDDWQPG